jgi:hypothetical protein
MLVGCERMGSLTLCRRTDPAASSSRCHNGAAAVLPGDRNSGMGERLVRCTRLRGFDLAAYCGYGLGCGYGGGYRRYCGYRAYRPNYGHRYGYYRRYRAYQPRVLVVPRSWSDSQTITRMQAKMREHARGEMQRPRCRCETRFAARVRFVMK